MIDAVHRLLRRVTTRMSLAVRVAVLAAMAVAVTLAALSGVVYVLVRAELQSSLDETMIRQANDAVAAGYSATAMQGSTADALALAGIKILTVRGGQAFVGRPKDQGFPFDHHEIEVSIGQVQTSKRTAWVDGMRYRIVAVQAGKGTALVLAQPLGSIDNALERLKIILLLSSTAGVALAGLAGWGVAANGLRPVRRLTAATERVARTTDLTPIEVTGHDELARLTTSFNAMLQALDASQERQRQLVADAGHELRTPLTSLRTNIELLGQADRATPSLSREQRAEIMGDVRLQLEELTTLVGDLVELARDEPLRRDPEPLDVADVVHQAVERVRLRAPAVQFDVDTESWMVVGEAPLLERGVTNLLDNAAKWSPENGTVRVRLAGGVLTVADEGPGIDPADLPHIFDRFYRSSEARTLPGSGLGLSIVRRAADRHGGTVEVESAPGRGSVFRLTLPDLDPDER